MKLTDEMAKEIISQLNESITSLSYGTAQVELVVHDRQLRQVKVSTEKSFKPEDIQCS